MTPPIPTTEPDRLYAGDTVKWTKTISDYPSSDGWTLKYSFRGPSALPDQTASASGSGYAIVIAALDTASLVAGTYDWTARVSKAGETYTVARGVFTVVLVAGATEQLHEEKVVEALKAVLEGRITADVQQYAINGRQVTKIPIEKIPGLIAKYERKIWRLRNPGKIGVPVAVAFTPPDGQVGTPEPVSLPPWYRYGG